MQHLSQDGIAGKSHVVQGLVETSDRAAIHFVVLSVSAMHLDDGGFLAVGIGICGWSAEDLSPISCEPLDMFGVEAVAEGMSHYLVVHHATMPCGGKTVETVAATRRLKDSFHAGILTAARRLCKPLTPPS